MQQVENLQEAEVLSRSVYQQLENLRYKNDKDLIELQGHQQERGQPLVSTVRPVERPGAVELLMSALGESANPMNYHQHSILINACC